MRLLGGHRDVPLTLCDNFLRCGPGSHATRAAVEANAVHRCVSVDDRGVVSVAYDRDIYVGHLAVVVIRVVFPIAAEESDAGVAKTVIDSAIVADFRPPIARVPNVEAVFPSPISRSP